MFTRFYLWDGTGAIEEAEPDNLEASMLQLERHHVRDMTLWCRRSTDVRDLPSLTSTRLLAVKVMGHVIRFDRDVLGTATGSDDG